MVEFLLVADTFAAVAQVVERRLGKAEVTSSSLVSSLQKNHRFPLEDDDFLFAGKPADF